MATQNTDKDTSSTKKYFKDISPRAWEHPADRAALTALKQVPALDEVIRFFVGATNEKALRLLFLSSAVRVSESQFSRVNDLLIEACKVLDIHTVPELYVVQNPVMNAGAIGVRKPFITINSSLLSAQTDEEISYVIGHELAHIASGHVLYKTLLWFLTTIARSIITLPIGQVAILSVFAALQEWNRKSELSADRAGLLVVQDVNPVYTSMMKFAGGPSVESMNVDEFLRQAEEYDATGDLLDGVYKFMNLAGVDHPFPVLRIAALRAWVEKGGLDNILEGNYQRRGPGEEEDVMKDFQNAAHEYQEDLNRSKDPLAKAMKDVADSVDKARQDAESFFRSIFG